MIREEITQMTPNNQPIQTWSRVLSIFMVLTLLVFSLQCSKKKDKDKARENAQQKRKFSTIPVITKATIDPAEPAASHLIRVIPVLENAKMRNVTYTCKWFVEGDEIPGQDGKLLDKQYYEKGDRIYCEVTAIRGEHTSEPVESNNVTVSNSKPVINLNPVNPFAVPGRFIYTINASDPDGDRLTYRLLEPQGRGIQIDAETGEITWDIPALPKKENNTQMPRSEDENPDSAGSPGKTEKNDAPKEQFNPSVTIVFEVRDTDDAVVTASITLNLNEGGEMPQ